MNIRKDLAEEYDALKRPDQAEKFRAELASLGTRSAAESAKR